jgi:uncharacterized membrane protein
MAGEGTALLASISFALFAVYGWLGLRHSTPVAGTIISLAARTVTLGAAVVFTGGIPSYARAALAIFVFLGLLQSSISLLTFVGLGKIGTARSQPLRNSYPLWSSGIAIAFLGEEASLGVLAGTFLVVVGVVMISWKPEAAAPSYRWWHVLYSLTAGFLAGLAFPLRRYGSHAHQRAGFFQLRRRDRVVVGILSLHSVAPLGYCHRLESTRSDVFCRL